MQVVEIETPFITRIGYGIFISIAHVVWFALVSLFFSAPQIRQRILKARHWIDRIFGMLLVGFGFALAAANTMH
jgi:threonine/homoserine/homoserine lactone efflux protein